MFSILLLTRAFHTDIWVFYVCSSVSVALLGWLDDLYSLPGSLRLGGYTLSAMVIVLGIGYWEVIELPYIGRVVLGKWGILITLLWIVGLTNAYNFMDGIDGMAGSQAIVSGLGWVVVGELMSQVMITELGVLLTASTAGFMLHNWYPARIFMGDVGATFLGFSFASLAIIAGQHEPRLVFAGIVFVWPFVLDTSFTLIRRLFNRENIFTPHQSHFYQRLVISGYRHDRVACIYAVCAAIGETLAILWWLQVHWVEMGLPVALFVMVGLLVLLVYRSEK